MRKPRTLWAALVVLVIGVIVNQFPIAREPAPQAPTVEAPAGAMRTVSVSALPPEARETLELILQGGPFPYRKDGTVFGNRERLLAKQEHGYYREYTVRTPGASNRGARRIVTGGPRKAPVVFYYTSDHYRSFRRIIDVQQTVGAGG